MNYEPFHNGYIKQHVQFEFWPSKGVMKLFMFVSGRDVEREFDMRDVFFLHGWLGSMIQHYMNEIKKGSSEHSKEMREIMKACAVMSKRKSKLQLEQKKEDKL